MRGFKKVGLSVLPLFSLGMMVESILTSLGITVVCGDETTISFVLPSLHPLTGARNVPSYFTATDDSRLLLSCKYYCVFALVYQPCSGALLLKKFLDGVCL